MLLSATTSSELRLISPASRPRRHRRRRRRCRQRRRRWGPGPAGRRRRPPGRVTARGGGVQRSPAVVATTTTVAISSVSSLDSVMSLAASSNLNHPSGPASHRVTRHPSTKLSKAFRADPPWLPPNISLPSGFSDDANRSAPDSDSDVTALQTSIKPWGRQGLWSLAPATMASPVGPFLLSIGPTKRPERPDRLS